MENNHYQNTQPSSKTNFFIKVLNSYLAKQQDITNQLLLQRKDFIKICKQSLEVHSFLERIPVTKLSSDESLLHAYVLFSRVHLLSKNIMRDIKRKEKPSFWDYTSMCINARSLIEAVEMLFHIYLEDVSNDERSLRLIYQQLRNSKYYIKNFESGINSKDITQDQNYVLKAAIDSIEETANRLIEKANSNEFYKRLAEDNTEPCLDLKKSKSFQDEYLKQKRFHVEKKMQVVDSITYIHLYHELSFFVHPYDISSDPKCAISRTQKEISDLKMRHASSALSHSILYLRYAAANIIHKLILNDISDLFIKKELDKFRDILRDLQSTPHSLPLAKELKLVNIGQMPNNQH